MDIQTHEAMDAHDDKDRYTGRRKHVCLGPPAPSRTHRADFHGTSGRRDGRGRRSTKRTRLLPLHVAPSTTFSMDDAAVAHESGRQTQRMDRTRTKVQWGGRLKRWRNTNEPFLAHLRSISRNNPKPWTVGDKGTYMGI